MPTSSSTTRTMFGRGAASVAGTTSSPHPIGGAAARRTPRSGAPAPVRRVLIRAILERQLGFAKERDAGHARARPASSVRHGSPTTPFRRGPAGVIRAGAGIRAVRRNEVLSSEPEKQSGAHEDRAPWSIPRACEECRCAAFFLRLSVLRGLRTAV